MLRKVKLGDVCKIINGSTPRRNNKDYWKDGSIPWLTIADIRKQGRDINFTSQTITEQAVRNTSLTIIPENSVILCCTASLGVSAITRIQLTMNQQFNSLIPKENNLLPEYLYYVTQSLTPKLLSLSGRATINFVAISKLKEIQIPLPPLTEQQRIVAKLDTGFAEIDKQILIEQKKVKQIDLLAENFLDSELDKINSKENMPISDFCYTSDYVSNGSFASLAENVRYLDNEDYAILIRLKDYRKNFKNNLKYVSEKSYNFLKNSKVYEGDLILTNVGAYSGTPFIIPKLSKPATLGPNSILVRPDNNIMSAEYLKNIFKSNIGKSKLESISTGTTHKKFNKTAFRKTKIEIPELDKQMNFLNKLKIFEQEINLLKRNQHLKIKNYLALKNLILKHNLINKSAA